MKPAYSLLSHGYAIVTGAVLYQLLAGIEIPRHIVGITLFFYILMTYKAHTHKPRNPW